jgi:hypothetical protein
LVKMFYCWSLMNLGGHFLTAMPIRPLIHWLNWVD